MVFLKMPSRKKSSSDKKPFKIHVSEKIGDVSAVLTEATDPIAILTLAHGAGTDMNHKFMTDLASALAAHQVSSLRFNFPYTENGRKMPDRLPVATATVKAVLEHVVENYELPVFAGGKSFGGRMTSHTASSEDLPVVKGLIFFGFPLHPPGAPSVDRAEHLKDVKVPMLFLQGDKDALAYYDLISKVSASLKKSTLEFFDNTDHSFNRGKQTTIADLAQRSGHWIKKHI